MVDKQQYDALVFSGGGVRGISQLGCVSALIEQTEKATSFYGTSIGALWAAVHATRRNMDIVYKRCMSTTFTFEPCLDRLGYPTFAVDTGNSMRAFIRKVLGKNVGSMTLMEAHTCYNTNLVIVATDICKGVVYISKDTFPNMTIERAVCISASVPLLFGCQLEDGRLMCDGALVDNFPVKKAMEDGCKTILGISVSSTAGAGTVPPCDSWNLSDVIHAMVSVVLNNQQQRVLESENNHFDHLHLQCDLPALELDASPEQKAEAYAQGVRDGERFLRTNNM